MNGNHLQTLEDQVISRERVNKSNMEPFYDETNSQEKHFSESNQSRYPDTDVFIKKEKVPELVEITRIESTSTSPRGEPPKDVDGWTVDQVWEWLQKKPFAKELEKKNWEYIDGNVLVRLDEKDVKELANNKVAVYVPLWREISSLKSQPSAEKDDGAVPFRLEWTQSNDGDGIVQIEEFDQESKIRINSHSSLEGLKQEIQTKKKERPVEKLWYLNTDEKVVRIENDQAIGKMLKDNQTKKIIISKKEPSVELFQTNSKDKTLRSAPSILDVNEPNASMEEKVQQLQERSDEILAFVESLSRLTEKLEQKKVLVKKIIEKKIDDNLREVKKWKDLLVQIVDESIDEKIEKLSIQEKYFRNTQLEIAHIIDEATKTSNADEGSDSDSEDPKVDDYLALALRLQPEGLTVSETLEIESEIKKDFEKLLSEIKKSLRRTYAYVGGIIRGYLRRGNRNINWIHTMRKLEGRAFDESSIPDNDPYIGTKLPFLSEKNYTQKAPLINLNISHTWDSVCKLFENRNNHELRSEFCEDLNTYYEENPEDVMFYLPQLIYLLLNQSQEFSQLKKFILEKCTTSVHFALKTYLLVRTSRDARQPPKKKKVIPPSMIKWRLGCDSLLEEIQEAVTAELSEKPFEQVFKYPIEFMDTLVAVCRSLYEDVPTDQYANELKKKLQQEDAKLQQLPPEEQGGPFVYIPLLKPVGSYDHHRVVRILAEEAYAVPTYSRVLFYCLMEVIDHDHVSLVRKEKEKSKEKKGKKVKKDTKEESKSKEKENRSREKENKTKERENKAKEKEVKPKEKEVKPKDKESKSVSSSSSTTVEQEMDTTPSVTSNSPEKPVKVEEEKKKKRKRDPVKEKGPERKKLLTSSTSNLPSPEEHGSLQRSMNTESEKTLSTHSIFGEPWETKSKRIRSNSQYASHPRWRMQSLLVKYGDEVLQEEFAMQLIVQIQRIFDECGVPAKVVPYRILAVSAKSGLIEPIPNSFSLDKLKKQHTNLVNFFAQAFGQTSEPTFKQAQSNFARTLAGYSVVCYILQIKDRHNGNILLDATGQIIHIDFGYFLAKSILFEKAPFKLSKEFVEVLGGYGSPCYKQYCRLCVKSFLALRQHYKKIMLLVEMTMEGQGRKVLPCLKSPTVLSDLKERFHLDWSDEQCSDFFHKLIEEARGSWRTLVYDAYQLILNNNQEYFASL